MRDLTMPLPDNFNFLSERVFAVCGFTFSSPVAEAESAEYQAYRLNINGQSVCYRQAKITPTKVGQFVTFWKRTGSGPIQPIDSSDKIDFFVVTVKTKTRMGQFVFPKSALIKHGILSVKGKGGKRALRVYPSWNVTESKQALKTQAWQLDFFAEIPKSKTIDIERFKLLYNFPS